MTLLMRAIPTTAQKAVLQTLQAWSSWSLYPPDTLDHMRAIILATAPAPMLPSAAAKTTTSVLTAATTTPIAAAAAATVSASGALPPRAAISPLLRALTTLAGALDEDLDGVPLSSAGMNSDIDGIPLAASIGDAAGSVTIVDDDIDGVPRKWASSRRVRVGVTQFSG